MSVVLWQFAPQKLSSLKLELFSPRPLRALVTSGALWTTRHHVFLCCTPSDIVETCSPKLCQVVVYQGKKSSCLTNLLDISTKLICCQASKFHLRSTGITRMNVFGYVIYYSAGTHCQQCGVAET